MSVRLAKTLNRLGLCVTFNGDKHWWEVKIDRKKAAK